MMMVNTSEQTIRTLIDSAVQAIATVSSSPLFDIQIFFEEVSNGLGTAAWIAAHGDDNVSSVLNGVLTEEMIQLFNSLVDKRLNGIPVAYCVGWQEFYGRRFSVDERVLIPRPETEMMIDVVMEWIRARIKKGETGENDTLWTVAAPLRMLDIGTGSGCISVTLAGETSSLSPSLKTKIVATDISADALVVAQQNAAALGADSIFFAQGDLYNALSTIRQNVFADEYNSAQLSSTPLPLFDIILSNPPYVDMDDVDLGAFESSSLAAEPRVALEPTKALLQNNLHIPHSSSRHLCPKNSSKYLDIPQNFLNKFGENLSTVCTSYFATVPAGDSFSVVARVLAGAVDWLAKDGLLCIEIGHDHGARALDLAQQLFPTRSELIKKDLAGFDRFIIIT